MVANPKNCITLDGSVAETGHRAAGGKKHPLETGLRGLAWTVCLLLLAFGPAVHAQPEPAGPSPSDAAVAETAQPTSAEAESADTETAQSESEVEADTADQHETETESKSETETGKEASDEEEAEKGNEAESTKPKEEVQDHADDQEEATKTPKRVIGATARVQEMQSGIVFNARIDTGAETCSIHVETLRVDDEDPNNMEANLGKIARFQLKNGQDEAHMCRAKIVSVVRIKNAVGIDRRYKVVLTLSWGGIEKKVRVSLNDRSDMKFPMLIGRNFLRGDFLVDVSKGEQD